MKPFDPKKEVSILALADPKVWPNRKAAAKVFDEWLTKNRDWLIREFDKMRDRMAKEREISDT